MAVKPIEWANVINVIIPGAKKELNLLFLLPYTGIISNGSTVVFNNLLAVSRNYVRK